MPANERHVSKGSQHETAHTNGTKNGSPPACCPHLHMWSWQKISFFTTDLAQLIDRHGNIVSYFGAVLPGAVAAVVLAIVGGCAGGAEDG